MNLTPIREECKSIIHEGWTDGITVCWGNQNENHFVNSGLIADSQQLVSNNTLFDLASLTKLFTLFVSFELIKEGKLLLDDDVGTYTNQFPNIKKVKIYELMNFSVQLSTPKKITDCRNSEHAAKLLSQIYINSKSVAYSDMGAIVLSKIIDYILIPYSSFYEYSKNLFAKWKLTNTYWWIDIPESKLSNIQCYDNEFKFYNNQYVTLSTPLGTVHDPKARIIGVCGHAGIFSCADDIRILSQKLLSGEIFDRNIVNIITHQTYDSVCATNHFGLLCYKKYENARQSEIPYTSSDSSIAISGYTGTYWLLDFELNNFLFIGTNRLYNRLSNLTEIPILNESIDAPIRGTKDYVYRKDVLRDLIINVKPSAYP